MVKKLNVVTVNGNQFLGTLVVNKKDEKYIVKDAFSFVGEVNSRIITDYFCAVNNGSLTSAEYGGSGVNYGTSPLNDDLQIHVQMCELSMVRAKALGLSNVENGEFTRIMLGK